MAIALVGSLGPAIIPNTATVSPAFGQATTAGNLLIAWVVGFSGSVAITCSDPSWSRAVTQPGSPSGTSEIWYKPHCGAGEAAPTFSQAGALEMGAMLGEFSGANTGSPVDKTGGGTSATSPLTVACSAPDAMVGDLIITATFFGYSKSANVSATDTYNNGATANVTTNGATVDIDFAWGITTGNSVADSDTLANTGMNLTLILTAIASFLPVVPPPFSTQQGPLRDDPNSLQVVGQAVKRGAYYMSRWQRRRSGLIVPESGVLAPSLVRA